MRTILYNRKSQKDFRKELRNNPTIAEQILWKKLKNSQTGYKFRRQQGIGKYIVDFYCPKLKLAIEIDGDSHYLSKEVKEKDDQRENYLKNQGVKYIKRYTNIQIKKELDSVLDDLYLFYEQVKQQK